MAAALKRYNGGRLLVFVMRAFAEMSGDVSGICDITAHDLARTHVSYCNGDANHTKGVYRYRTQKAWGYTAQRGWARLLLDRTRDLIIYGPARHGASGAAMPTDEDGQYGHFLFSHPEGDFCRLDPPPRSRGARRRHLYEREEKMSCLSFSRRVVSADLLIARKLV